MDKNHNFLPVFYKKAEVSYILNTKETLNGFIALKFYQNMLPAGIQDDSERTLIPVFHQIEVINFAKI